MAEQSVQDLAGKVVVITGAGSGIGRSTASLLARHGAKVHVADIDEATAQETVRARAFFTIQDDALSRRWFGGRVFVNPPYA